LDQRKQEHEDSLPFYDLADCMTYTEAKGYKKVKIIETNKSENKQVKVGQKNYGQFYENFKQA
jgi:hypothetical protein